MSAVRPIRVRVAVLLAAVFGLAILGAGVHRTWGAKQRPPSISGVWLLDDLRTSGDDASIVVFLPSGVFESDPDFGTRWRFQDGRVHFRSWRIDGRSNLMKEIQDSTLYSWFADSQEFSLGVELSNDGNVMTLTEDGEGPRCRLRRVQR